MDSGKTNAIVFRIVGLHQHRSRTVTPSSPSRHLSQDLKSVFGSAEIRPLESDIRAHHPNEGDVGKVMAFGNHLSANENVSVAPTEIVQQLTICHLAPGGISVHPADPGSRQKTPYFCLHPLGTEAKRLKGGSIALRAHWGHIHGKAAEMATQLFASTVPGETHGAIVTVGDVAALAAEEKIGVPASIDEQESLLASSKRISQGLAQGRRYQIGLFLTSHVDDGHLRQRPLINAVW